MVLTFSPALRTRTTLPIPPSGRGSFRFTASFATHAEYEQARQEGTRVEMWTNLPVGGTNEWHALPFVYAEARSSEVAPGDKLVSLVSSTFTPAHEQLSSSATLDISLAGIRPGSTFSFTYRLVRPWGAIDWLGAYGQNGELFIEEKDVRFTLSRSSKIENGAIVSQSADTDSVVVATLNNAINWACWGFSGNVCTCPSTNLSLSPSSAALLVPRNQHGSVGVVDVKPLILKPTDGQISLTEGGDIVLHHSSSLAAISVDDIQPFSAIVQRALAGFAVIIEAGGFALLAPKAKDGDEMPVRLSAIPIYHEAWNAQYTDFRLGWDLVHSLLGGFKGKEAILVNPSLKVFSTLSCGGQEDLVIRVAPPGDQVILAPLHDLAISEAETSASLAILSPSASALVQVFESISPSALLTPPPSPPPPGRSSAFAAATSSVVTPTRPVPLLTVLASSEEECVGEAFDDTSYAPLTPTSPPLRGEDDFVTKEDLAILALVPHQGTHMTRGGSLRFILAYVAWLIRASFARICAMLGGNVLFWLTYRFFGINSPASSSKVTGDHDRAFVPEVAKEQPEEHGALADEKMSVSDVETLLGSDAVHEDIEQRDLDFAGNMDEEDDEGIKPNTSINDIASTSPSTRADPGSGLEPPLIHTPIALQQPPQPLRKERSRFVADVHSDLATLVVRSQMKGALASGLDVIANGERIPISDLRDGLVQLSADTYLLELRLPAGACRLEVGLA